MVQHSRETDHMDKRNCDNDRSAPSIARIPNPPDHTWSIPANGSEARLIRCNLSIDVAASRNRVFLSPGFELGILHVAVDYYSDLE